MAENKKLYGGHQTVERRKGYQPINDGYQPAHDDNRGYQPIDSGNAEPQEPQPAPPPEDP